MQRSASINAVFLTIAKIIIYITPFIPLYISTDLIFPYITGKNFVFRVIVELAAVLCLSLIVFDKSNRPTISPMMMAVLTFTLVTGIADLFGINAYRSFWSNYERMEGYITIVHLALYFVIIKVIFKSEKDWTRFFSLCVIASVLASLFALIEPRLLIKSHRFYAEYGGRLNGTLGNPPFFASYLLLCIFLGLILIFKTQNKIIKFLLISSIILNSVTIYLTASRGAIIALAISVILIWISFFNRLWSIIKSWTLKKSIVFLTIMIALVLLFVFSISLNIEVIRRNETASRFLQMLDSDVSIETRLNSWSMAWNGIKRHPILGWGQENYSGIYSVNHIPLTERIVWLDRAHNIIIDWLVNSGILGLLTYLSIYCVAFYTLFKKYKCNLIMRNENLILAVCIFVYFIQNQFTFDTISTYLIFFALIAYIDDIQIVEEPTLRNLNNNYIIKRSNTIFISISVFFLIIFLFIGYRLNYLPWKQLHEFSRVSKNISNYNSFNLLLNDLIDVLSYSNFGDNYVIDEMAGISHQLIRSALYERDDAIKFIERTALEYKRRIDQEHNDLESLINAIYFFYKLSQIDYSFVSVTDELIKRCYALNPAYDRLYGIKAGLLLIKKDYEKAYKYLSEIAPLDPDNPARQFMLTLASIGTFRESEAESALFNVKRLRTRNNKEIASGIRPVLYLEELFKLAGVYAEVKKFDEALAYYDRILHNLSNYEDIRVRAGDALPLSEKGKNNKRIKVHIEKARIYILQDKMKKAEREIKKIIELNPSLKGDQIQEIINLLKK